MHGRRLFVFALTLCVLALGLDLTRPVESQVTSKVALSAIDAYQATASKVLARGGARCRFKPTCSNYGEYAIRQHGVLKGGWMTVKRIFRCGPWTPMGTWDPPPGTPLEKLPPPTPAEADSERSPSENGSDAQVSPHSAR